MSTPRDEDHATSGGGTRSLAGFRALTFDVVGTLIDFEAGILACVRRIGGSALADVDDTRILEEFAAAEDAQQRRTPEMPFTQMLDPIAARIAARTGWSTLDPGAGPGPLRRSITTWPAFPDAPAALARLRGRFRLVALTNADLAAATAMSRTLGDPFADLVTAEEAGVNKPDPRVFALGLDRLAAAGVPRSQVLHVAQSQYHDIGAAHRLGLATCWVERRRGRGGHGATPAPATVTTPDRHVGSLDELADLVDSATPTRGDSPPRAGGHPDVRDASGRP